MISQWANVGLIYKNCTSSKAVNVEGSQKECHAQCYPSTRYQQKNPIMKQYEETTHQSSPIYLRALDREYKLSYHLLFVRDTTQHVIFTKYSWASNWQNIKEDIKRQVKRAACSSYCMCGWHTKAAPSLKKKNTQVQWSKSLLSPLLHVKIL